MNNIAKSIIELAAYIDMSEEDVIESDSAVEILDALAVDLRRCSKDELDMLSSTIAEMITEAVKNNEPKEKIEFYRNFVKNIRLDLNLKEVANLIIRSDADEYCEKLRAKGINAEIGILSIPGGNERFIVKVPDEQYEQFKKLDIQPRLVDEEPILSCPYCGSADVKSHDSSWNEWIETIYMILILPMIIQMITQLVRQKTEGDPYICNNCKKQFRFKL